MESQVWSNLLKFYVSNNGEFEDLDSVRLGATEVNECFIHKTIFQRLGVK